MRNRSSIILVAVLLACAVHAQAQDRAAAPSAPPTPTPPPAAAPQPRVGPAPGLPTVAFAPVLERVARTSNKRFLLDNRVGPEIYLGGVEPNDVTYPVLLSILRANDLAAVEIEGRVNIVPAVEIRFYPVPIVPNDDAELADDEWVTRVLTTVNVDSGTLVPILRPMLPQEAHLAAHSSSSRLVIFDRYANVKRITAIVRALDVPGARNQ